MNIAERLQTIADNVPKVYQAGYDDGVAAGGGGANPSEIVENLPIALDFSDGDQEIVAPDGVLVKSAIIQKPETLNPENIAEGVNIAGIVGTLAAGGGTSDELCYVTFMSYDGSVEYGKKAVAVGDDCADPIARGIFNTPTRESDAQYNYTFAGWATIANGGLDGSALNTVNEDRTVYANFAPTARLYTARFYDGDTLMSLPQQVAYGSKAVPPDTTKDGYTFDCWTPADLTVYGDIDFVGNWVKLTGLFYVTTVNPGAIGDISINRNGTELAVAPDNAKATKAVVYNLNSNPPSELDTVDVALDWLVSCDYDYQGARLCTYNSLSGINVLDANMDYKSVIRANNEGYGKKIRCSPVSGIVACAGTSKTSVRSLDDLEQIMSFKDYTFSATPTDIGFSPDGNYIATSFDYTTPGVDIFRISDGSHVCQLTSVETKKISWSKDGTKIAISLKTSPWVEIYETSTWTKLCDIADHMTKAGRAEFVANTYFLIVGSGKIVKAFDLSGTYPQEIEGVPAYSGQENIVDIRSSFGGNKVAIRGSSEVIIWGVSS